MMLGHVQGERRLSMLGSELKEAREVRPHGHQTHHWELPRTSHRGFSLGKSSNYWRDWIFLDMVT
jgi:hypothetical protein